MKILIAVASKCGSTREIAEVVAEEIAAQGFDVDLKDVKEVHALKGYDVVILGSAVYMGNWLPEAKRFAQRHQAELKKLPVWLFSSGPIGTEDPKPQDDPAQLAAPLGDVPVRDHHIFVGKLELQNLNFAERLLTRALHSPTGDFRNWDEIRAWAREIAQELQAERIT